MNYPREFFGLQLRFGEEAARVLNVPFGQALLTHTHLFVRLGCGRLPDAANGLWRSYAAGLAQGRDTFDWTWRFHLDHRHLDAGPRLERACGCFGYERRAPDRLRLHFLADAAPPGLALAASQVGQRRQELARLFEDVARQSSPPMVIGTSWLYGHPAYRRLFPAAYLAGEQVLDPPPWQRMPLWGQFLDRDGQVRDDAARHLLERAGAAKTEADLAAAFPLPVIATQAPASVFAA